MKKRLLPKIIMILAVTALVLQISITSVILVKGEVFDGRIIRFISSLVTKPGDLAGVIVGLLS